MLNTENQLKTENLLGAEFLLLNWELASYWVAWENTGTLYEVSWLPGKMLRVTQCLQKQPKMAIKEWVVIKVVEHEFNGQFFVLGNGLFGKKQ